MAEWRPLAGAAGVSVFLAASALAVYSFIPADFVAVRVVEALVLAGLVSSLAVMLDSARVAEALAAALRGLDAAYRVSRAGLAAEARARVLRGLAALGAEAAAAARGRAGWGLAAAAGGLPALYLYTALYAQLWRGASAAWEAVDALGLAVEPPPRVPGPGAALAALFATLGLAAPLVGGWMARLSSWLRGLSSLSGSAPSRASSSPGAPSPSSS